MSTWYVTAASISPNMSTTCLRVLHGSLSDDAMLLVMPLDWLQKLDVNEGSLILRWWWAKFVNTVPFSRTGVSYYPFPRDSFYTSNPFPGTPSTYYATMCLQSLSQEQLYHIIPFPGTPSTLQYKPCCMLAVCCVCYGNLCQDSYGLPAAVSISGDQINT